jgi:hypothetical protein
MHTGNTDVFPDSCKHLHGMLVFCSALSHLIQAVIEPFVWIDMTMDKDHAVTYTIHVEGQYDKAGKLHTLKASKSFPVHKWRRMKFDEVHIFQKDVASLVDQALKNKLPLLPKS